MNTLYWAVSVFVTWYMLRRLRLLVTRRRQLLRFKPRPLPRTPVGYRGVMYCNTCERLLINIKGCSTCTRCTFCCKGHDTHAESQVADLSHCA